MLNLIPDFIQSKLEEAGKNSAGTFEGHCLFVDIAGFTPIADKLMEKGKPGAEDLSVLINRVYRPLIRRVHANGGFIAVFGGDSITAVFPDGNGAGAMAAALSIRDHFSRRKASYRRYSGGAGIEVRAGLASGEIHWAIFGEGSLGYVFHGDAVTGCSSIIIGTPPGSLTADQSFREDQRPPVIAVRRRIKPSVARRFFPDRVVSAGGSGEFRNSAVVFLGFPPGNYPGMLGKALNLALSWGGYWNGVFCDEKGVHALVVFGAPVSWENNRARALDFAGKVMEDIGTLKAGVSAGTVYAGIVGSRERCTYTVLGNRVNEAAKMMHEARPGVLKVSDDAAAVSKGLFQGAMTGRDEELSEILRLCEPVFRWKPGGFVSIHGQAGIGKSRLLHELKQRIPQGSAMVFLQADQVIRRGLHPFRRFLSGFFHGDTGSAERFEGTWNRLAESVGNQSLEEELRRTRPFLAELSGIPLGDQLMESLDARARFDNTIFAVKDFFKALSLTSPLIIVIEDFHWLDPESVRLTEFLVRNPEGFPFMVIASCRTNDDGTVRDLFPGLGMVTENILLEPLPMEAELKMINCLLPESPTAELMDFILRRTQGNPFYVEQYCSYLSANSLPERKENIPEGITAVLVARIDRLSAKMKDLVQRASVLGREFHVDVLSSVFGGGAERIRPLLEEGESEAIWSHLDEFRYIFRHSILRDTIYGMQMRRRLRKLHLMAARAMEELFPGNMEMLSETAYHFESAHRPDLARPYLKRAAEYARDNYRNEEALDLFTRLLPVCGSVTDEINVSVDKANVLIDSGRREEARGILSKCLEKAENQGLDDMTALCCRNLAKLCHRQGDNDEAVAFLNRSLEIYRSQENTWELAGALNVLGNINTVLGNYDEALENFRVSSEAAEAAGDRITLALNISNVGNIHLYRYELDQAEELYLRAIEESRALNEKRAMANSINNMAVVCYYRGDFQRCREYLNLFVEISTETGNKEGLAYIFGNMGILEQELGNSGLALDYHGRQLELAREIGDMYNVAKALHQTGQLRKAAGDFTGALDNILQAVEITRRTANARDLAQCVRDLGVLSMDMGSFEEASLNLQEAFELGSGGAETEVASSSRMYQASLSVMEGEPERALAFLEEAVELKRELGEPRSLLKTLVTASEILLDIQRTHRAWELLTEAESLLDEDPPEDISARCRALKLILDESSDPAAAARELEKEIHDLSKKKELQAYLFLKLHGLTGKEEHRLAAVESYRELYRQVPRAEYSFRLKSLGAVSAEGRKGRARR